MAERPGDVQRALGGLANSVAAESERAINQSLANSPTASFSNFFSGGFNYGGANMNYMIASNIGLFFNSYF